MLLEAPSIGGKNKFEVSIKGVRRGQLEKNNFGSTRHLAEKFGNFQNRSRITFKKIRVTPMIRGVPPRGPINPERFGGEKSFGIYKKISRFFRLTPLTPMLTPYSDPY